MVIRVFMICNSYESGYGHGLADDGLDLSKTPHTDPEQGEAYQLGYEAGQEIRREKEAAVCRKIGASVPVGDGFTDGVDSGCNQCARAIEAAK